MCDTKETIVVQSTDPKVSTSSQVMCACSSGMGAWKFNIFGSYRNNVVLKVI
jgi:hypothetical protein